ncbi:mucin-16-like [Notamacropus eugenii]|uniref:mucin-16-like n=1 Tax=Notamacropus eugenii TaxID=9315 RepID=UPI003B67A677
MSSPVGDFSSEPPGYRIPSHTPGTIGTRFGGEVDSSLVLTTPAFAASITITNSPELLSRVAESSADAPLTNSSPKAPLLSDITHGGLSIISTGFIPLEKMASAILRGSGSNQFNATASILQNLLHLIFEENSIGSHHSGCQLTSLRSVKKGTAVNILCIHWKVPTIPSLDGMKMYQEFSNQTHKITRLGLYTLHKKSLYINAGSFSFESFTLNFTITNLMYTAEMGQMGSSQVSSPESDLKYLFSFLLEKTSIGSLYSDCKLTLLRPLKKGTATGIVFTYACQVDVTAPLLKKEQLYWELSNQMWNITRLGPYTLDERSLYSNGGPRGNLLRGSGLCLIP